MQPTPKPSTPDFASSDTDVQAFSTTEQAASEMLDATKKAARAIAADATQVANHVATATAKATEKIDQAPKDRKRAARMALSALNIVLFAFAPWFSFSGFYSFNLFGLGDALARLGGAASSFGASGDVSTGLQMGGTVATVAGIATIGVLAYDLLQDYRKRPGYSLSGCMATLIVFFTAVFAIAINSKSNNALSTFSLSYDVITFSLGWYLAAATSLTLIFISSRKYDAN